MCPEPGRPSPDVELGGVERGTWVSIQTSIRHAKLLSLPNRHGAQRSIYPYRKPALKVMVLMVLKKLLLSACLDVANNFLGVVPFSRRLLHVHQ